MGTACSCQSAPVVEDDATSLTKSVRITLPEGASGKYVVYEKVYVCRQGKPGGEVVKRTACVSVHAHSRPPRARNITFSSEVALRRGGGSTDLDFRPVGPLSRKIRTQRVEVGTCRHVCIRVVAVMSKPLPGKKTFLIPIHIRMRDEPQCPMG